LSPEARAGCGNAARPDLWRGLRAIVISTPTNRTPGLVVLRGPDDLFPTVRILVHTLVNALANDTPSARLWIIEPGRVRIHEATLGAEE
jgi:hypothetical protein